MHKREDVRVLQDEFSVRKGLRGMPGAFLTEDDAAVVLDLLAGLLARCVREVDDAAYVMNAHGRLLLSDDGFQVVRREELRNRLQRLPLLPSDGPPDPSKETDDGCRGCRHGWPREWDRYGWRHILPGTTPETVLRFDVCRTSDGPPEREALK